MTGFEVKEKIKQKGFSLAQVARNLGISPQALQKNLSAKDVKVGVLEKIADSIGVNVFYFFESEKQEGNQNVIKKVYDAGFVELPYVPIAARATFVGGAADVSKIDDTYSVWRDPDYNYMNAMVMEINGDSMEPTLAPGSKVLIKPVVKGDWIYLNPGVYVVSFRDMVVVKRVKDNDLLEKGFLKLYSDNPQGGSMPVKEEDIYSIYRVERIVDAIVR